MEIYRTAYPLDFLTLLGPADAAYKGASSDALPAAIASGHVPDARYGHFVFRYLRLEGSSASTSTIMRTPGLLDSTAGLFGNRSFASATLFWQTTVYDDNGPETFALEDRAQEVALSLITGGQDARCGHFVFR